jgi:hypothetical protein
LTEHEHVVVSVTKVSSAPGPPADIEFLESLRTDLRDAGPAPGLEEVRRRLAKIPGSMTDDFIAEREER